MGHAKYFITCPLCQELPYTIQLDFTVVKATRYMHARVQIPEKSVPCDCLLPFLALTSITDLMVKAARYMHAPGSNPGQVICGSTSLFFAHPGFRSGEVISPLWLSLTISCLDFNNWLDSVVKAARNMYPPGSNPGQVIFGSLLSLSFHALGLNPGQVTFSQLFYPYFVTWGPLPTNIVLQHHFSLLPLFSLVSLLKESVSNFARWTATIFISSRMWWNCSEWQFE